MRAPYPGELRMCVIEFVEDGASRREAAEQYAVSPSTAVRWVHQFREDGTSQPMPRGEVLRCLRSIRSASSRSSARSQISRSMRLLRHCANSRSREAVARCRVSLLVTASPSSLQAAERKRADVARARRCWIREQGFLESARLVFIDETAVTTNMVRLNGWNPRGEACALQLCAGEFCWPAI